MGNLNFINKNLIAGSIACALLMGGSPVPSAEGQSVPNKDQKAKNEEQRQKNIKQLNEYYAAEKKHMEQQDRYAAEWAKKTPEERKKAIAEANERAKNKPPLTPEQEAKRQKDIKQLNEYYSAEKKHMEQQDRYAAEWAKKTPEERKKGSSTKSGSGEVKPVILPPVR
jgi:uncharacterized coiled-coil DUF342 family protein